LNAKSNQQAISRGAGILVDPLIPIWITSGLRQLQVQVALPEVPCLQEKSSLSYPFQESPKFLGVSPRFRPDS
jgi:hypothetical protein